MIGLMGTITWANAQYLFILIPVLIGALGLLIYRFLWQKRTVLLLASPRHLAKFLHHFSLAKSKIKLVLLAVSLVFLTLGLMRPQWEDQAETVEQQGRDVLIALDISRSMLAADVAPSRLEAAKNKIKKLVASLTAERVGLIVFSGAPFVQCPLTSDIGAFLTFLDSTDAETISSGTTAVAAALEKALDVFNRMATKKNKLLVVFTDGEDFSPQFADIKKKAQAMGLHIFTVGVGTAQGAPIPLIDEQGKIQGYQKDENGNIVISRLNEGLLQNLAKESGAVYVQATPGDKDIETLLKRIRMFEKEKFDSKRVAVKKEKYYYFGACALAALLIEWIL